MRIVIEYDEDYLLGIDNIYDADLDIILSFTDSVISPFKDIMESNELMALCTNCTLDDDLYMFIRE